MKKKCIGFVSIFLIICSFLNCSVFDDLLGDEFKDVVDGLGALDGLFSGDYDEGDDYYEDGDYGYGDDDYGYYDDYCDDDYGDDGYGYYEDYDDEDEDEFLDALDFLGGISGMEDLGGSAFGLDGGKLESVMEVGSEIVASIDKSQEEITPEVEYYIGRSVAASILHEYKVYKDDVLTDYLNKICYVMVINSDKPYLFKGYYVSIVDSDEINAISTPGGHIFISRGLLECTESEDALAGVIAHEIAHIQLGHSSEIIKTSRNVNLATSVVSGIGKLGSALMGDGFSDEDVEDFGEISDFIFKNLINVGFSQVQEYDADSYAVGLMKKAGYNPYALIDMLEAIKNHTDSGKGWFKTHPKPEYRINNVKSELENNNYYAIDMRPRADRFQKMKARLNSGMKSGKSGL